MKRIVVLLPVIALLFAGLIVIHERAHPAASTRVYTLAQVWQIRSLRPGQTVYVRGILSPLEDGLYVLVDPQLFQQPTYAPVVLKPPRPNPFLAVLRQLPVVGRYMPDPTIKLPPNRRGTYRITLTAPLSAAAPRVRWQLQGAAG